MQLVVLLLRGQFGLMFFDELRITESNVLGSAAQLLRVFLGWDN